MKVAHGPEWLREIDYFYGTSTVTVSGPIVQRFRTYAPIMYIPEFDRTLVFLALTIKETLTEEQFAKHEIPEEILESIQRISTGEWKPPIEAPMGRIFSLADRSTIHIRLGVYGKLQHFDAFLRSVARKLRG